MLKAFTAIIFFQIGGDLIHAEMGLLVPGSVIGMALLLAFLIARRELPQELDRAATGLLRCLPMLFVPAGAGIMTRYGLVEAHWVAIAAAIVGSSVLAVAITAATMRMFERLQTMTRGAVHPHAPQALPEGAP